MADTAGAPDWLLALLAGLAGGVVRALSRPEQHWPRRIAVSLVGGLTSVYGTPILAPLMQRYLTAYDVSLGSVAGFCGFLLGMAGLSLCEAVIRRIRRLVETTPADLH